MPETLRDLVVTLSLNTDNFSRNINSINRQIREAESAFRLAGAGVQNYSQTTDGMANRLSMLNTNLGRQRDAVSQYERALAQAIPVCRDTCWHAISEVICTKSS